MTKLGTSSVFAFALYNNMFLTLATEMIFQVEHERQVTVNIGEEKFHIASVFESKNLQRVWFWIKSCLQSFRFWISFFAMRQIMKARLWRKILPKSQVFSKRFLFSTSEISNQKLFNKLRFEFHVFWQKVRFPLNFIKNMFSAIYYVMIWVWVFKSNYKERFWVSQRWPTFEDQQFKSTVFLKILKYVMVHSNFSNDGRVCNVWR